MDNDKRSPAERAAKMPTHLTQHLNPDPETLAFLRRRERTIILWPVARPAEGDEERQFGNAIRAGTLMVPPSQWHADPLMARVAEVACITTDGRDGSVVREVLRAGPTPEEAANPSTPDGVWWANDEQHLLAMVWERTRECGRVVMWDNAAMRLLNGRSLVRRVRIPAVKQESVSLSYAIGQGKETTHTLGFVAERLDAPSDITAGAFLAERLGHGCSSPILRAKYALQAVDALHHVHEAMKTAWPQVEEGIR